MPLQDVAVTRLDAARFRDVLVPEALAAFEHTIARGRELLGRRTLWSVSSTARGGGVAEMLQSLLGYVQGAGVDARWVVIAADPDFFAVTKRLHNRLHGDPGDGGDLGEREREVYEACSARNAEQLAARLEPGDIVLLHDPQTAGMVPLLSAAGMRVVWRAHIGLDLPNDLARDAWRFLTPYVEPADAYVFSREAYRWPGLDEELVTVIPPSIDAFAPKNHAMAFSGVTAVLRAAGPVVASDVGGIKDQIVDGRTGYLVAPHDLAGFGARVTALLREPHDAERIGQAAQARVRDAFLGPRHLGQYVDLLDRALARAPLQPIGGP